ncbi:MAG: hypothetical protein INQ03_17045 [Candidatus Heimdallarchaeota archaeon]|nr:hypothetical protein [Candidatus Heimdallarchaeota archaeon]
MTTMDWYSIIFVIISTGIWILNRGKTGISDWDFKDLSIFVTFLTSLIPLAFWLWHFTDLVPGWLNRFQFEEFITGSTLILISSIIARNPHLKHKNYIYFLALLPIFSGIFYLFSNISIGWEITLVMYSSYGLITNAYAIQFPKYKIHSIGLFLSFGLSFALFFNETIFLIAVILYLVFISSLNIKFIYNDHED